jgi:hypothetical protein
MTTVRSCARSSEGPPVRDFRPPPWPPLLSPPAGGQTRQDHGYQLDGDFGRDVEMDIHPIASLGASALMLTGAS